MILDSRFVTSPRATNKIADAITNIIALKPLLCSKLNIFVDGDITEARGVGTL